MKVKFEYVFSMALLIILAGALVGAFKMKDKDLINMLLIAFVGAFGSITAFFFTKKGNGGNKGDGPTSGNY